MPPDPLTLSVLTTPLPSAAVAWARLDTLLLTLLRLMSPTHKPASEAFLAETGR